MRTALAVFCLSVLLGVGACAGIPAPAERQEAAEEIASEAGLAPRTIETRPFDLLGRMRKPAPGGLLTIYIEGDGFAWERRGKRSTDPTPIDPLALKLAAADPATAVAWLARPCQFTGGAKARNCTSDHWTAGRYGEEVVSAMNEALDVLKREAGASRLALVGYSGGGAIAALLAIRRTDIVWLKTVASPLDTEAFTSFHKVTPLSASLNPAESAGALAHLPQIHYVGEEDNIVPAEINRRFLARMGATECATLIVMPGMDHGKWAEVWGPLATDTPACR